MVFFYGIHFFDYLFNGISISIFTYTALFIFYLFKDPKIYKTNSNLFLFLFIFFNLLSLVNIFETYFEFSNFLLPFLKLLILIFGFMIFSYNLMQKDVILIDKFIKYSILILTFLGFYQLIVHYFFPSLPYSLSISFLESRGYSSMISYGGQFRIKSIFSEPAHFAIYLNMLYFFILNYNIKFNYKNHFFVNFIIFITLSMSGLILLFVNHSIKLIQKYKIEKKVLLIILFLLVISIIYFNVDYVNNRINNIVSLKEGSGSVRLLGGWELAKYTDMLGIGLGNIESFVSELINNNVQLNYTKQSGSIHNSLSVVLITSGYLGLITFLLFLFSLYKNKINLLFVLALMFSWGRFNTAPFWFFLVLVFVYENQDFFSKKKGGEYDENLYY